jgi:hypothetical protein
VNKTGYPRLLAASMLGAGLLLAACGSSGSGTAGSSAPTTTLPTLAATPTTLHLFLHSQAQGLFGPDGKPGNPNQPPAVGDYFTDSDIVYSGSHSSHPAASMGSAHLICAVTAVSGSGGTGVCNGLIDLGGSLLVADHQSVDLSGNNVKLGITGGTGRYEGAQGTLSSADVGNTNDTDVTLSVSRPSGQAGPTPSTSEGPSPSSTPQSLHYYSVSTVNLQFGPDGKAITDSNAAPAVGDYFVSSDNDYTGTHTSHDKSVAATDHLVCVLTAFSPSAQAATAVCDGGFAIGNSMLVAEHQTVQLSNAQGVSVSLTAGTGRYQGAHGAVQSSPLANSNNSDVTVTFSR